MKYIYKYMNIIGIVMILDFNYIGTSFNGSIQEVKSKGKNIFSFFKKKGDRTYHWVGHSKLKKSYINYFFERKQVIEDLEAELTGAL